MAVTPLRHPDITGSAHEDLLDEVTNISPTLTPFLSNAKPSERMPRNLIHQWPTDTLTHPSGASTALMTGFTFASATLTGRTRLVNYVETQAKQITVADDLQEYIDVVGADTELGYQLGKAMKELALTLEYRFWSAATGVSGSSGGSGTAAQIVAIPAWVTTNASTATADRAVSRALVDGVLQDIFTAGGTPDMIFCGAARKTGLAGIIDSTFGTRQLPVGAGGRVVQTVDIYEGSFGVLTVKPCVYGIAADIYFFMEMDKWRISWGVRPRVKEIAKTGDFESRYIKAAFTLEARAEASSGKLEDIS